MFFYDKKKKNGANTSNFGGCGKEKSSVYLFLVILASVLP